VQYRKAAALSDTNVRFFHEGFDLFSFPSNANLLVFDIYKFVDKLVEKYRRQRIQIDAVVSTHEQFGALASSLMASRLGLPSASTMAILNAQHKLIARQLLAKHAPDINVPFTTFPYTVREAHNIDLPFPFYAKPVKAAFSILARKVDDFADLRHHLNFRPWEMFIIKRLVRPFNDVVEQLEASNVNGHFMIGEEIIGGFQVNVDGLMVNNQIHILGIVDAVMYPGTDAFLRWEYPSRLPPQWQQNIRTAATRTIKALGYDHGLFNVEIRVCTHSGDCKVIEVNPRMAAQFSDLYEAVDGINLHHLALQLALGETPQIEKRVMADRVASSFVYRRFDGAVQEYFPNTAQIKALQAFDEKAWLITYVKKGNELEREMRWLKSYRYACLNLAAASEAELTEKYHRASEILGFQTHP
jgi:biotin carboxylase